MYNQMTTEAGGLALPQRFALYNRFLWSLKLLLVRHVVMAAYGLS